MHFDFVFMDCGASVGWRIYIINNIDYKGRNTSSQATHRLHVDGETYKFICWDSRIATLEDAKSIASLWADATMLYIRTGKNFDKIAKELLN